MRLARPTSLRLAWAPVRAIGGRVKPLRGTEKPAYELQGGKTVAQLQRHMVRDAETVLRRHWAEEERAIVQAAREERRDSTKGNSLARKAKRALKQELSAQKVAYYAQLRAHDAAARAAAQEKRLQFFRRKQEVLAEARREMVKALCEDEQLWSTHPAELINRRYKTIDGAHYLKIHN